MTNTDPVTPSVQYEWQNPNHKTFNFGRVLGEAFTGVFANMKPLAIAVVISLSITIILNIISTQQLSSMIGDGGVDALAESVASPAYWAWSFAASIPALFLFLWIQLIVVQTSYSKFTNSPPPSTPLKTALRFVLPMFVISVIYIIVCTFGFYLLLIGFIFIWPGWALAGPILVFEKKGIFGSLGEAWNLSRGSKRWIFLLLTLLVIIGGLIYAVMLMISVTITSNRF